MRLPVSCEPRFCMGLHIPDSYRLMDAAGIPVCEVNAEADALFLVNLLNLTSQDQRDAARAGLYRSAAE